MSQDTYLSGAIELTSATMMPYATLWSVLPPSSEYRNSMLPLSERPVDNWNRSIPEYSFASACAVRESQRVTQVNASVIGAYV